MNNLSFYWNIIISFNFSFFGNILNSFFWNILRYILSQILNSIIIYFCDFSWNLLNNSFFSIFSDFSCSWNSINMLLISILDNFFFKRNILNSTLSFDDFFSHINSCIDNLGLMAMMNINMFNVMMGRSSISIIIMLNRS